ncbi:MAG: sulfatase-like hydrolase/transferase [Acidobacteria bacterium]|nr:sulfatase-like hydrolase/transferase [Acidobacteriota bacterium]
MDRRSFLKTAGAVTVAATTSAHAAGARKPRQIIFMMTDTTRRDMLNCYKVTGLQTPNLDRIAAEGVRFERAYTTQPVCAPARSALWTGTYPHSNGVWGNSMPLGQTVHTLGEFLSSHKIHCAHVGKWHLDGFDYFGTGKAAPGWDPKYWYDQRDYLMELTPEERKRSRNAHLSRDPKLEASFTFAHRCSNRAIDFIEKHKNEDFLLVVSYDEPHGPSVAPTKYGELYAEYGFPRAMNFDDTLEDKPEEQRIWAGESLHEPVKPMRDRDFFGSLTFVDAEIGRVLDQIDKSTPDALVMYTSDHGDMLQSHHLMSKGPAMYEEVTNIPLLARWKGVTPANVSSGVPASHIDISGTFMEFFGLEVPKTFEGGSMLASLKDPKHRSREHCFIEWGRYEVDHDGFGGFQPIRCVTDGRWKLSVHLLTTDEFYDMQNDPGEMHNLINDPAHAEMRNKLHDILLDGMDKSRDPFRGYYWARRPWRPDYPVSWEYHGMTRQRESDGYLPRELDYDTGLPMKEATRPKVVGKR